MDLDDENIDQGKRNFLKAMAVMSIAAAAGGAVKGVVSNVITPSEGLTGFPTMTLVDSSGSAIKASQWPVNSSNIYLFYYPLTSDPNFFLNLGDSKNNPVQVPATDVTIPANGTKYKFPGGVGPSKSIVASSAICQHLGCVPPIIHYYQPGTAIPGHSGLLQSYKPNSGLIHCNCHGSTYDPFKGFSVVTGPTARPLPTAVLSYNESDDTLSVNSMIGPTIYGKTSDLSGGTPFSPGTTETQVENTGAA